MMVSYDRLQEILDYEPSTGVFTWKVPRGNQKRGNVAGAPDRDGYTAIKIEGKSYMAHRLAWFYVYSNWPKYVIDHKNHVKSDNRISNLQDVPHSINEVRKKSRGIVNLKGVCKKGNKFQAQLDVYGKRKYLGLFDNPVDAHLAWGVEARKLHGSQFFCDCAIHSEVK